MHCEQRYASSTDNKKLESNDTPISKWCSDNCMRWLWWSYPLNIRSFHRQPSEPNGCVMSSVLPWMSEPSVILLMLATCHHDLSSTFICNTACDDNNDKIELMSILSYLWQILKTLEICYH